MLAESVVVLDFETTGRSPTGGDRITEVAALRVEGERVVERFVTLVNAGVRIPRYITELTGITNEMIASAPPATRVVRDLVDFVGSDVVVAHNASFDNGFLMAECERAGRHSSAFRTLCTVRLARRFIPGLRNYKLPTVAEHLMVRWPGRAHRADADAEVTAQVLMQMVKALRYRYRIEDIDPDLLVRVTKWPVDSVDERLTRALARSRAKGRTGGSGRAKSRDVNQPSRRWRLYAAGNLRDTQEDRLYYRTQVSFQEDTERFLVVRTDSGAIRVPIREVMGADPREVLGAPIREKRESRTKAWAKEQERVREDRLRRWTQTTGQGRRPWMYDSGAKTLKHRATGRTFRVGEYERQGSEYAGGYATRDRDLPWANDNDIEVI